MQTTPDTTGKERVLKLLAVGGFIALIILIAWLGIQLVRVAPSALTSLASIADVVYNYEDIKVDVASDKAVANADESFGLSWHVPKTPGDFVFAFTCTDGIAIDVRTIGSEIKPVLCGDDMTLGSVSGVDVLVHSEKNRFADIPYSITFVPTNENITPIVATSTITVVNAAISPLANATTTPTLPTEPVKPNPVPETPKPAVVPTPAKPTKPVTKPVTVPTYTYAIPVSNPNGYTDIVTTLIQVGTINNGSFLTNGVVDNDTNGAILFAIKNIGTKTSDTFTYTVSLPDGTTYTSPVQSALKPNERAQIAIGFTASNMTGAKSIRVTVTNAGENNLANNSVSGSVVITN
jgi:hypothetical protein